ncbi:putative ORFan [Tupanvirus deep ocean]|uniref:ORFan n=2 Tax=Tupanvirus TaxID=2094720 RepID=A0AC62A892_9VIRU|nr:putative ORFan [Tupanvirus deep ocean]QKU33934.1 putative ORFan [Tupanvirus deep ocean]
MDNAQGQTNQFIFYIIAIAVLAFIFYIWVKQPSMQYYQPPNYHIYYNTHNDNKQHFEMLQKEKEEDDDINTESIAFGGHNSAHNSQIIASPYNPPKKSKPKGFEPMPKYLSPYYQLHKRAIYPAIPQQKIMNYYH